MWPDGRSRRVGRRICGPNWAATTRNIRSVSPVVTVAVDPIHKIKHVVIIMQENRSFDHYFGTYPGADGIPPGVCVPDPQNGGCVKPFHDPPISTTAARTASANAVADINGGQDGRLRRPSREGQELPDEQPQLQPVQPELSRRSAST